MILMPDPSTAMIDPFFEETTLLLRCDVVEPTTMQGYSRDPRSLAKRAEAYLKSTGIADSCLFGPENEFFIFDSARWTHEINVGPNKLTQKGDEVQALKYALWNVAHGHGKTLTFMPKPLVGDNGSGMHVHQSLQKDGKNIFAGERYAGLSDIALYYIGGIIKHARAINAFTNPGTNSYKRLVPGFEAPVMLAYSARNRSASIRIPWVSNPKGRRIEVRFPDSSANPYFAFASMMMAGLDGIQNKIHPGEASDKDLYDLPPEEAKNIPEVCHSLDMALDHLDRDREFLKRGGVFSDDLIDAYIGLKQGEVTRFRMSTHPVEMDLYFSL
jgi:glutamine synthetase